MRHNNPGVGPGVGIATLVLFALAFVNVKLAIDLVAREQMTKDRPNPKFVIASRMWNAAGTWVQNMIVFALAASITRGFEAMAARAWIIRHAGDDR